MQLISAVEKEKKEKEQEKNLKTIDADAHKLVQNYEADVGGGYMFITYQKTSDGKEVKHSKYRINIKYIK